MADRRPSKNVNDVKNCKLINILTEKYLKRRSSRVAVFTSERKVALCMQRFILRVLKLAKQPRMKYSKGTNKGTLEVRRKCGAATVKVRFARSY